MKSVLFVQRDINAGHGTNVAKFSAPAPSVLDICGSAVPAVLVHKSLKVGVVHDAGRH